MSSSSWVSLIQAAMHLGVDTRGWVLIDIPGFGRSDQLYVDITLGEVGRAITSVLTALERPRFHLVGHSMGGFLALDMSAAQGDAVLSVTSISGAYRTVVNIVNHPVRSVTSDPRAWLTYSSLVVLAHLGPFARPLLHLLNKTQLLRLALNTSIAHPRQIKQSVLDSIVSDNRPGSFLHAQETGRDYDVIATWQRICQPVLSIVGARDKLVPVADHNQLVEATGGATELIVGNAAHFAHIEQPYEVAGALEQFLS